jgi:hypothetical protein
MFITPKHSLHIANVLIVEPIGRLCTWPAFLNAAEAEQQTPELLVFVSGFVFQISNLTTLIPPQTFSAQQRV